LPAFGEADLSNCEREQVHLAGSIQPHGVLILVDERNHVIVQTSENASAFLNLEAPLIGRPLSSLGGDLADRIRPYLAAPLHSIPAAVRCFAGNPAIELEGLIHRPPGGGLIIELERAEALTELPQRLDTNLQAILACSSISGLCDYSAEVFKTLTGYDRVMVYRFDDEGHGEVISERREEALEPYLGNWYPASDIPQMARRLYERNRVRVLVDVDYEPVPLAPRLSPITDQDLDMSLCVLRSMSPIHIQYLKNMGVGATLVISLMVGGKLWGLIACHHYERRVVRYEIRGVCELLAEAIATRIAALESFEQAQAELSVRRLEQRMMEAIAQEGDWRAALFDNPQSILQPLNASGVALLFEGQILSTGEVPGTRELRQIGAWLDAKPGAPLHSTSTLAAEDASFESLVSVASGLLAAPLSASPGEYLIWFRPERVHTVTWAGNPFKPVVVGDNPTELSPRRSFSQWHQLVEGTSEPWTNANLAAAHMMGESVADVVLQFRAVRTLIAQDQLAEVSRQVRLSAQPVVIVDTGGRILLTNDAFQQLLPAGHPHLDWLEELAPFFSDAESVRRNLQDLLGNRRPWRGEVGILQQTGDQVPLQVRADPVFSSVERILGFVFLFTDLRDRKAAETARRRFQEAIIDERRSISVSLDSDVTLELRNILTTVIENAQLAALEITDGVDVSRMPEMLESVRASIQRTAKLLDQLIQHSSDVSDDYS
jgi:light-regulated signal transduction histidine kinase (bacteriophytochrome)